MLLSVFIPSLDPEFILAGSKQLCDILLRRSLPILALRSRLTVERRPGSIVT